MLWRKTQEKKEERQSLGPGRMAFNKDIEVVLTLLTDIPLSLLLGRELDCFSLPRLCDKLANEVARVSCYRTAFSCPLQCSRLPGQVTWSRDSSWPERDT